VIVTIGMLEFTSIAKGYDGEDSMLKAGAVELVLARTICSGKYIVVVSGDVDAVKAAVDAGKTVSKGYIADELIIPHVHESVLPAMTGSINLKKEDQDALGIVETFSAASAIKAADAAAKATGVTLFLLHLAMAIGGKGYMLMTGDVASVRASVDAAVDAAAGDGLLVEKSIIPRPQEELFQIIL